MAAPSAPVSALAATVIGMPRTSANICDQMRCGRRRRRSRRCRSGRRRSSTSTWRRCSKATPSKRARSIGPRYASRRARRSRPAWTRRPASRRGRGGNWGRWADGVTSATRGCKRRTGHLIAAALDEFADVPFQVGGGGGAGLDGHEPVRGEAEIMKTPDRDRLGGDDLVDAPGSGDDRGLAGALRRSQGTRHDVEEPGDHRRALGEAGGGRGLGGYAPDDVGWSESSGSMSLASARP